MRYGIPLNEHYCTTIQRWRDHYGSFLTASSHLGFGRSTLRNLVSGDTNASRKMLLRLDAAQLVYEHDVANSRSVAQTTQPTQPTSAVSIAYVVDSSSSLPPEVIAKIRAHPKLHNASLDPRLVTFSEISKIANSGIVYQRAVESNIAWHDPQTDFVALYRCHSKPLTPDDRYYIYYAYQLTPCSRCGNSPVVSKRDVCWPCATFIAIDSSYTDTTTEEATNTMIPMIPMNPMTNATPTLALAYSDAPPFANSNDSWGNDESRAEPIADNYFPVSDEIRGYLNQWLTRVGNVTAIAKMTHHDFGTLKKALTGDCITKRVQASFITYHFEIFLPHIIASWAPAPISTLFTVERQEVLRWYEFYTNSTTAGASLGISNTTLSKWLKMRAVKIYRRATKKKLMDARKKFERDKAAVLADAQKQLADYRASTGATVTTTPTATENTTTPTNDDEQVPVMPILDVVQAGLPPATPNRDGAADMRLLLATSCATTCTEALGALLSAHERVSVLEGMRLLNRNRQRSKFTSDDIAKARQALGVVTITDSSDGKTYWQLPVNVMTLQTRIVELEHRLSAMTSVNAAMTSDNTNMAIRISKIEKMLSNIGVI